MGSGPALRAFRNDEFEVSGNLIYTRFCPDRGLARPIGRRSRSDPRSAAGVVVAGSVGIVEFLGLRMDLLRPAISNTALG
jgi:hypothetical protein